MLGACMSPNFIARVSHVNVSATSLALVCVDPEDPDETRRECFLRRLNRLIKLAEDIGLALGKETRGISVTRYECCFIYIFFRLLNRCHTCKTNRLGASEYNEQ